MSAKTKTLKRNKALDKIYHDETGLVVNNAKEKVVVGRIENGEFLSLDRRAVELAEEWNFEYDRSLLKEEEGESDNNSNEDENQDQNKEEKETNPNLVCVGNVCSISSLDSSAELVSDFTKLLTSQNEELVNFVRSNLNNNSTNSSSALKITELETELAKVRKELKETRHKLTTVLTAMQNTLSE